MSQPWQRSPAWKSSRARPTKTPKPLEEALLDIMRNPPGLTPETAKTILDQVF